jgi:cupin fold WbuC family metalloprotein
MVELKKINDEVYQADDEIVRLDRTAIDFIRQCALTNLRGRARICAHKHADDSLHEMVIGIARSSYVRPHRHHSKVESFHLIEGSADVIVFSDQGMIEDVIELGPERNFFYRLDLPRYHTVRVRTPVLLIHETTNGPFDPAATDFAAFAPEEGAVTVGDWTTWLDRVVAEWKTLH